MEEGDLERFQKEAIYRQLLEYKRLHQHSQDQLLASDEQLKQLQLQHAALSSQWQLFLADLESLQSNLSQKSLETNKKFDKIYDYDATALSRALSNLASLIQGTVFIKFIQKQTRILASHPKHSLPSKLPVTRRTRISHRLANKFLFSKQNLRNTRIAICPWSKNGSRLKRL